MTQSNEHRSGQWGTAIAAVAVLVATFQAWISFRALEQSRENLITTQVISTCAKVPLGLIELLNAAHWSTDPSTSFEDMMARHSALNAMLVELALLGPSGLSDAAEATSEASHTLVTIATDRIPTTEEQNILTDSSRQVFSECQVTFGKQAAVSRTGGQPAS